MLLKNKFGKKGQFGSEMFEPLIRPLVIAAIIIILFLIIRKVFTLLQ